MSLDLERLTPAPWYMELEPTKIILSSEAVQRIAWVFDENHTEFLAMARNAFDVMIRRGWYAMSTAYNGEFRAHALWFVCDRPKDGQSPNVMYRHADSDVLQEWPDPFTALVEADAWYKENVENHK